MKPLVRKLRLGTHLSKLCHACDGATGPAEVVKRRFERGAPKRTQQALSFDLS